MLKKMTKNQVLFIQLASFVIFIAFLIMNRYDGQIPDFVQGMALGMCTTGFVVVLFKHKLLKSAAKA
ncbi:hypothetical protein [Cohnella cholangitidis]|uniref:Uncharacterized protein n=1 Tax=Cohnella cholangitidis TaxID=2598458 RepID=A0A7G5C1D7_9BACL|nr:hypothetical protein [Cohnella cholangitidis]QMV43021.1 hypothetical protein FPL14_18900 [Cohnella cholangitidis]